MDVTPQVINEVEFHQKMRGYDPDEVDDFLERVAVAVGQLQDRVRDADERIAAADQRAAQAEQRARETPAPAAASASAPSGTDETETIRRTLVLAQRTADAAIKEAEQAAQATLQAAQEQVQRLHAEAQEQARKVVSDAEADARKSADDTRQRLVNEIITLEETRDSLRADHGILERHLEEQRLRLRSSISELQRLLDDPARLRVANPPELSGAGRPDFLDEPAAPEAAEAPPAIDLAAAESPFSPPAPAAPAPAAPANTPLTVSLPTRPKPLADPPGESRPITGGVTFTPAEESTDAPPRASAPVGEVDDDAWTKFVSEGAGGPPTRPVAATAPGEDAYLAELRKAMLDDTSAGTVDTDDAHARGRFGRRR
jgi:DivIVA domain-containing protein